MKVLCLVTFTDCENKVRSLQACGHEVLVAQYDDRPHERHGELVDIARQTRPDMILFIGAVEEFHHRPVPLPDVLRAINAVAPMVHMCDDAGDHPWWPWLETYDREKCFTVQVSIDGAPSPIERFENGLTMLTPIDPRPFHPQAWRERPVRCGLIGGLGHGERGEIITALRERGLIDFRVGPTGRSYDQMAEIMCMTKVVFCHPMTGSGDRMHVKGRVVEAGYAGACLLERSGSPTSRWFEAGYDYLTYTGAEDAAWQIERIGDAVLADMAARLSAKVREGHSPKRFWQTVVEKVEEFRAGPVVRHAHG